MFHGHFGISRHLCRTSIGKNVRVLEEGKSEEILVALLAQRNTHILSVSRTLWISNKEGNKKVVVLLSSVWNTEKIQRSPHKSCAKMFQSHS